LYRCVKNAGGVFIRGVVGCGRHYGASPLWVGVAVCIRMCGRLFIAVDGCVLPSCVEGFVAVNCFGWGFFSTGPVYQCGVLAVVGSDSLFWCGTASVM
jgi:hypothetical protein